MFGLVSDFGIFSDPQEIKKQQNNQNPTSNIQYFISPHFFFNAKDAKTAEIISILS
jgi:hypothetical protein